MFSGPIWPIFTYELHPVRAQDRSSAGSAGADPLLVILRRAPAIAGKYTITESLSSVPFLAVRQSKRYLTFQLLDAYCQFCRILRLSSFKTHLKKHGLDPDEYPGLPKRDNPFVEVWQLAEPQAMNEVQVSGLRDPTLNPEISLPDLPDAWDQFLSIPLNPSAPLVMQPGLTSEVSYSSPMVLAPSPRVAQTYNAGYFLSPPRPSPVSSSRYSSPMAPTPVLSPRIMPEFLGGIDVQSNPCSATGTTIQDWTASVWQGHGIQFVR